MGRVIAISNQKGGVGKTTTTFQFGVGLAKKGYKVLMVDMDPQGNLSFLAKAGDDDKTILDVITGDVLADDAILHSDEFDLLPASADINMIERKVAKNQILFALKAVLDKIKERYDFVVIDSPPTIGVVTINVITAADIVIIPAIADIYSLQGIGQIYSLIDNVKSFTNPAVVIDGIVLTRHSSRLNHSNAIRDMMEETADSMNCHLYSSSIREGVSIREAATSQMSIYEYAPHSKQSEDYLAFVDEFLQRNPVKK